MEGLPARIVAKIAVDATTGCWLWTAAVDDDGYGRVSWERRNRKAYRIVWTLLRGPIPSGLEPDHQCRVRLCVNPDHLELVTHAVNVARGHLGQTLRLKFSAPRTCPQNHPIVGRNLIVSTTKAGHPNRKCRACANAAAARSRGRQAPSAG